MVSPDMHPTDQPETRPLTDREQLEARLAKLSTGLTAKMADAQATVTGWHRASQDELETGLPAIVDQLREDEAAILARAAEDLDQLGHRGQ